MSSARCFLLLAALTGLLASGTVTTAPAQKKADVEGAVEVYEAKDGYRFRVKGDDGKALAQTTKAYKTKDECIKALDRVKTILNTAKVTEVKK